jgi:hypothetical protein
MLRQLGIITAATAKLSLMRYYPHVSPEGVPDNP